MLKNTLKSAATSKSKDTRSEIRNLCCLRALFTLGMILVLSFSGCSKNDQEQAEPTSASSNDVKIYVPCGMIEPFKALRDSMKTWPTPIQLEDVYDNAAILVKRIEEKGERPDLVVSPGRLEIDHLVKNGFVDADSVKPFGDYEIVVFVPRKNPAGIRTLVDIKSHKVKKVAFPDPDINSVGYYARQSLQKLGLWKDIEKKIEKYEHPVDAFKNVAGEKSDVSFAYRSCPLESAPEKLKYSRIRIVAGLPPDSYDRTSPMIGILSTSKRKQLAQKVIDFMLSDEGQKMLADHGVPVYKKPVAMFVPCGMISAIDRVKDSFERRNPGAELKMAYDRVSNLVKKIEEGGERPDLFMSPGTNEMDYLTQKGFIDTRTRKAFGRFALALFARKESKHPIKSAADLKKDTVKTISITNPESSSVGLCTKQALTSLHLWGSLKDKIKFAKLPKDSYKLVVRGEVDASFAYVGCPLPNNPKMAKASRVRIVELAPPDSYSASDTLVAILATSKRKVEAQRFIDYMLSEEGQKILSQNGIPNKK